MNIKNLSCGVVIYDEIREIQNLIPKLKFELKNYEVQWIFILNHEQSEIRQWIGKWIKSEIANAICIENPSNNLGFARHLILEKSTNDYIYFTDPDIDILHGNLKKLIELASNDIINETSQKIAGYGGTVTHKSQNQFLQATFNFMSLITRIVPFAFQIQHHRHLVSVDHLPACHLLLNRKIATSLGGFSPALNKYGEDLDFTHRAFNEDFRFIFLPTAEVIHWQNLSLAKWYLKILRMGRVQIPVQKKNYKNGIRYYRLAPMLSLIGIGIFTFFYPSSILLIVFITVLSLIFHKGFFGFALTYLIYAAGGLFELIAPLFVMKNEKELEELNQNLKRQLFLTNSQND